MTMRRCLFHSKVNWRNPLSGQLGLSHRQCAPVAFRPHLWLRVEDNPNGFYWVQRHLHISIQRSYFGPPNFVLATFSHFPAALLACLAHWYWHFPSSLKPCTNINAPNSQPSSCLNHTKYKYPMTLFHLTAYCHPSPGKTTHDSKLLTKTTSK